MKNSNSKHYYRERVKYASDYTLTPALRNRILGDCFPSCLYNRVFERDS